MIVALYILLALVLVGGLLYFLHIHDLAKEANNTDTKEIPDAPIAPSSVDAPQQEECCGMHITCEKDSLLASVSKEIEYYDDEELDAYRGRTPEEYDEEEIEQFRDVLLTLLPTDIAGWGRSLQLRGISLPTPVREELLMIVAEQRALHT